MTPEPTRTPHDPQATPTLPGPTLLQRVGSDSANTPTIVPSHGESPSTGPYLGSNPDSPTLAPPGFEILGLLGRGGMGVVYHAKQTKLNREVALKMILSGGHASHEDQRRFLAEAESIAALNHPGIVQVYEYGTHGGQPYFALEYCAGGSLAKKLHGTPLPPKDAASLVQKVAYAVHAAHEKGIVHRDLKPANVLLTALAAEDKDAGNQAETAFTAGYSSISSVKVTDFGLAKRTESGPDLTRTGAILGTPSYMAPEQALAKGKQVGPAADVYALGAILYELLTGRPPFKADNAFDTMLQVVDEDPVSVRVLQQKTPVDLETICHKCLNKDPARRYATAKELARDLGRWLAGEPIHARPAGRVEKAIKWAKRRPAVAGLISVSLLAAAALIGGGLYFNAQLFGKQQQLNRQQSDLVKMDSDLAAEGARVNRANKDLGVERETVRVNLARSNLILADSTWKDHDALGTLKALGQVPQDVRQWEWRYQQRRALGSYATLWGHTGLVTSVVFSPDGARLASGSWDKSMKIWDAKSGTVVQTLTGHTGFVTSVAFCPDGARLASGSFDKTVKLWDAKTGSVVQTLTGHTGVITSVAFSPDGARLASGSWDKTVKLWDDKTGVIVQTLTGHTREVTSVAFSPDGARLASGSNDNTLKTWDVKNGTVVHSLTGHTGKLTSVAFSPDCVRLASGSWDKTVKLWDAKTGGVVQTLTGHTDFVASVAFSPGGVRLASGSNDKTVKLWDAKSGTVVQTLTGHTGIVTSVAFSPDGARLASGSWNNTLNLWDAKSGAVIQTLTGHTGEVTSVAFSPDGARLASGSNDKKVKLWDAKTGAVVQALTGHTGGVARVAFSPDGARLASKDQKQRVKVWDVATGKETSDPSVAKWFDDTNAQSRSPDGKWFGIPHDDGTILLIKPLAPDDFELGYRAWFARPDPDWHSQQAQKFDKEQSWFAAAFHCEQVLKSRPDDAEAKTLLEKAREQLEKP